MQKYSSAPYIDTDKITADNVSAAADAAVNNAEKIIKFLSTSMNDPEIDYKLNFTFNKAQKREVRAALSNTFGFGGHNACAIVKKFVK